MCFKLTPLSGVSIFDRVHYHPYNKGKHVIVFFFFLFFFYKLIRGFTIYSLRTVLKYSMSTMVGSLNINKAEKY